MNKKIYTKTKIYPLIQKHKGSKTIKRLGLELRYDKGYKDSMLFLIISFMSNYFYIGIRIHKIRNIKII